jgi:mannonate dehydratase
MEQTWRWFGPDDAVTLPEICQTGATSIVTALHHIPYGVVWDGEEISKRKRLIESDRSLGLRWSVVESLPVAESIKLGEGNLVQVFDNYRASLRNLGTAGVRTVCYNFMPIVDWTRTQLAAPLPGGATALRFNAHEYAAFDCFMLRRKGAEADHEPIVLSHAREWIDAASESDKDRLLATIMAGLPGAYDRYDIPGLRRMLDRYADIDRNGLRDNLKRFLTEVVPAAEQAGVALCIHPDDPPRPVFGLPRVVSTADDLDFIVHAVDSPANGITLCTGSLGAHKTNDLGAIARRFAPRTHFVHLRNVTKEADGSFVEADHLGGDVDMVDVVTVVLDEQSRRKNKGQTDWRIPFRPDHGHEMLDDSRRKTHPGYPLVGRLRGLAEIRGVIKAVAAINKLPI